MFGRDKILTRGGRDRAFKLCRCDKCGKVERCTPLHDFYVVGWNPLGKLHCESCMLRRSGKFVA